MIELSPPQAIRVGAKQPVDDVLGRLGVFVGRIVTVGSRPRTMRGCELRCYDDDGILGKRHSSSFRAWLDTRTMTEAGRESILPGGGSGR